MTAVHLSQELGLEARVAAPDGAGGTQSGWESLGTLWADVRGGSGRIVGGRRRRFRKPLIAWWCAPPQWEAQLDPLQDRGFVLAPVFGRLKRFGNTIRPRVT